jgi:xanthosine utilization system XapX-like protein
MFSSTAQKWVRVLSYNAGALSASFAAILIWLNIKNTLPPIIGLVLLLGFFLPLAVALVTRTLLVLLKRATAASEELEGVV